MSTIDTDTRHLQQMRKLHNVTVYQHDITTGLPAPGPFDVIHARQLGHLPQRQELLQTLIDALTPDGWLVLSEMAGDPPQVLTAPSPAHAQVFTKVLATMRQQVQQRGGDPDWATRAHTEMVLACLWDVHSVVQTRSIDMRHPAAGLHRFTSQLMHDQLLAAGITNEELETFCGLACEPLFTAMSPTLVCVAGRRPYDSHRPTSSPRITAAVQAAQQPQPDPLPDGKPPLHPVRRGLTNLLS